MKKISLIIFSKDRPMQLDLLLRSLAVGLLNSEEIDITVIWTGHGEYSTCEAQHKEFSSLSIDFVKETNLRTDVINAMRHDVIGFMVDDDYLFANEVVIPTDFEKSFSLRLGKNIKVKSHFKYGFSVDGHFYHKKDLVGKVDFDYMNPNKFEGAMCASFGDEFLPITFHDTSSLVGIPNNVVSISSRCSSMGGDINELHRRYAQHQRINFPTIDLPDNTHKEIPYEYGNNTMGIITKKLGPWLRRS